MKLAVSNIAWDSSEDEAVAAVLRRHGARGVEIAPTKWRPDPLKATAAEVAAYRRQWADRGLDIAAMQSLLFGRIDLQLFGDESSRTALAAHLARMLELAGGLGAGAVVFGSPRNRTRGDMAVAEAMRVAAEFFAALGPTAESHRVAMCIEPVPARYGCDFVRTPAEALALCRAVDHPWVRVNADLGAMTLAGDDPQAVLRDARGHIGHFHASEPDFVELGDIPAHQHAAAGLRDVEYDGWVSIEMRASPGGDRVESVDRALAVAAAYRRIDA
jgi:sugar phosphate isomerase/epimerase